MSHIQEYAIRGNAIIGIRDSGKSYAAMQKAEDLLDAGIPFVAFDPIGVWRSLKVGVDGNKGYPVVVAGGYHPDVPLTEANCILLMRAAMRENISIVFDLFSLELKTKASQRRVVQMIVDTLLYENLPHGIRHVFIEEAAEYVPQQVYAGMQHVYGSIESMARLGRNSGLGFTIINQRAEQVNKAILGLCDYSLWFRQVERNSLQAIQDWLKIRHVTDFQEIIKQIPKLGKGECFAVGEAEEPALIHIPKRKTFHPDPRDKKQSAAMIQKGSVNVTDFVDRMNRQLDKLQAPPSLPKTEKELINQQAEGRVKRKGYPKKVKTVIIDSPSKEDEMADKLLMEENEKLKQQVRDLNKKLDYAIGGWDAEKEANQKLKAQLTDKKLAAAGVDMEFIVQEVLKRIPASTGGAGATYTVAPLEKIKKDFMVEAKNKIVQAAAGLDQQQKKMLLWLEQHGKMSTKATMFESCFGKSATSGSTYTSLVKKVTEIKNLNLIRVDTQQRMFPNLKDRIAAELSKYDGTGEDIETTYNHVLHDLIG
jgi:hypothetical protein